MNRPAFSRYISGICRALGLLLASCSLFAILPSSTFAATSSLIQIRSESLVIRSGKKFRKKAVHCLIQRNRVYLGYLETRTRPRRVRSIRKLSANTRTERSQLRSLNQTCQTVCQPQLSLQSAEIQENRSITIPAQASSRCTSVPLQLEIVQPPQAGSIETLSPSVTYNVRFFSGTDSFRLRSCTPWGNCSNPAEATISIRDNIFTGRPYSLERYKDNISEKEVRYLLNKVAFGGCEQLVTLGTTQGLSALVDTLLDDRYGGCTYALPLLTNSGFNTVMNRPDNIDPDAFGYWMAHPAHWGNAIDHWTDELMFRVLSVNARYHSPLQEYMALQFWHQNFPAPFLTNLHDGKLHYNTLGSNALGYFGDFFKAFFGPLSLPARPSESQRVPGVDPLLSYNPDRATESGVFIYPLSGQYRAYGDKTLQIFLNNETNSVQSRNENLARELNEIFIAGTHDLVTGERNYVEDDVITTTYGITGLSGDYDALANGDGNTGTNVTAVQPDAAGPWRWFLGFFPGRTDLPLGTRRTLFAGKPFEHTAVFSAAHDSDSGHENILEYLLNQWPASSRRLAGKLITQLVNPHAMENTEGAEAMVEALRARLLTPMASKPGEEAKPYNIREILRVLLKSEAFFSEDAYQVGFPSPFENVFTFLRRSNMPLKVWFSTTAIQQDLERAGNLPGKPPSVFGWPSYGVPGSGGIHDGKEWLNPTPLLGVLQAIMHYLEFAFQPTANPPDVREVLFPGGMTHCNPQDASGCPTAAELVDHVLKLFNLNGNDPDGTPIISDEERQILIEQIDPPSSPWAQLHVERYGTSHPRVMELLYLVGTHPARFLK